MKKVSERGVFYDLSISPYEFENPYNSKIYKFSSAKKLEMFISHLAKERIRYHKIISKLDFMTIIEKIELSDSMERRLYDNIYNKVVGV